MCHGTVRQYDQLVRPPGSPAELERRLRTRGTETEASIQRRLQVAADEMKSAHRYDYIVVNEEVSRTVQENLSTAQAVHLPGDEE